MADASATASPDIDASPGALALPEVFARLSEIGFRDGEGVMRLAASAKDGEARRAFADWMAGAGARLAHDEMGNQFACFDWAGADAPWVFSGSHLDAQPEGGRVDGALGVVAAGCAALTLSAEHADGRLAPRANLAVVNWTNEEGARFQPSLSGSSVFAGAMSLEEGLSCRDGFGTSMGEALAAIGFDKRSGLVPPHPLALLELHAEQGLNLVNAEAQIGLVEGTWAARKIQVTWHGRATHTGPTPMELRRDALLAAARGITAFEEVVAQGWPQLYRSAARLQVFPNSPNVVVSRATVWFELRHPDIALLATAGDAVRDMFARIADETGVRLEIDSDATRAPARMDGELLARIEDAARACGHKSLRLASVAGHDAVALQNVGIPAAVIFVPSVGGIAHHRDEETHPADMQAGLAVLTHALRGLLENPPAAGSR